MSIEIRTSLSSEELTRWRRKLGRGVERVVAQGFSRADHVSRTGTPTADGAGLTLSASSPAPRLSPREVHQRVVEYQMDWARKSKADYLTVVKLMRQTNPWQIAHLTDEQAAQQLEEGAKIRAAESVNRVFHKQGRGRDLQIKTGGY